MRALCGTATLVSGAGRGRPGVVTRCAGMRGLCGTATRLCRAPRLGVVTRCAGMRGLCGTATLRVLAERSQQLVEEAIQRGTFAGCDAVEQHSLRIADRFNRGISCASTLNG